MMLNIHPTSAIDKITRVTIATLFVVMSSQLFLNLGYSGLSFYLFAISISAVSLPFTESLVVYFLAIIAIRLGIKILPESFQYSAQLFPSWLNSLQFESLSWVLKYAAIIPVVIFGILKIKINSNSPYTLTIAGIVLSWLLYFLVVPFLYVTANGISVTNIYLQIFRYLFSRNIIIHISLAIITISIFPIIWELVEKKRKRIRNIYKKQQ